MVDLWLERCREGVARELKNRDWRLVSAGDAFLTDVAHELRRRFEHLDAVTDKAVAWAAVRCYTRVLYGACGDEGTDVQRRAFLELWDYLFAHARYQLHDDPEAVKDALQQALVKIWEKRTSCTDIGSFLGWCDQVLRNEIRERFREQYERRVTDRGVEYAPKQIGLSGWVKPKVNEETTAGEEFVRDAAEDTLQDALRGPMRAALLQVLRDCLEHERQFSVIVALFLKDATVSQIAEELQTTPINAQVMKSRALQKLRDCLEMQALFEDWLA